MLFSLGIPPISIGIIIGIFMKNLNLRHLLGGRSKIKAPRNRADEVSGYWNNAYYIAAPHLKLRFEQ